MLKQMLIRRCRVQIFKLSYFLINILFFISFKAKNESSYIVVGQDLQARI